MDQISNNDPSESGKSAIKAPTRIFKMPLPKPHVQTYKNPFKASDSVETFGGKPESIKKRATVFPPDS